MPNLTDPLRMAPKLTDDQASIIAQWAELHRDKLRAVLLYGSRLTGHRRIKPDPKPIPDVDLALLVRGTDRQRRLDVFDPNRSLWAEQLKELLGYTCELYTAHSDIDPCVHTYLIEYGYRVLWCDEAWTPDLIKS